MYEFEPTPSEQRERSAHIGRTCYRLRIDGRDHSVGYAHPQLTPSSSSPSSSAKYRWSTSFITRIHTPIPVYSSVRTLPRSLHRQGYLQHEQHMLATGITFQRLRTCRTPAMLKLDPRPGKYIERRQHEGIYRFTQFNGQIAGDLFGVSSSSIDYQRLQQSNNLSDFHNTPVHTLPTPIMDNRLHGKPNTEDKSNGFARNQGPSLATLTPTR